ncbi:hypothetical protein EM308_08120 [Flavobacterium gilvum]|uniref:Glycoside hydrolase n=2 Tax=Flavobacterium gilvum TaxID=1492737 RepID=A0AAC9I9N5_9FLAO|nr:hypothetical protein EM308_08120 [Flavobacterium gilvum]
MKFFKLIVIAFFLCSMSVFSQENTIKHTIVKGETISSIAQKYNVSISDIYKLNPKAKKTLQLNQVLSIPKSESDKDKSITAESEVSEKTIEVSHVVLPKETLYGFIKQYKTNIKLLYKANPKLETEGLKIGQTIVIPSTLTKAEIAGLSSSTTQESVAKVETEVSLTHEVKAKESLYAIAKMYGVTLKEIQNANPSIGKKGLGVGQIIQIPSNGKMPDNEVVVEDKKTVINENPISVKGNKEIVPTVVEKETKVKEQNTEPQTQTSEIIHEVLTKETKYGIAKKYGISVSELEKQNPATRQKLLVGSKLNIQVSNEKFEEINKDKIVENKEEIAKESPREIVKATEVKDTARVFVAIPNVDLIDKIIQSASEKIGVRYRTGGTTTAGFDCSGLLYSTFAEFDLKLPRSSIEQAAIGEKVNDEDVQKGDLIFFKTNGRRQINHVGMVIEVAEDEIKFIHSSIHSGVIISSTKEPYYQRNFAQVNRVIK